MKYEHDKDEKLNELFSAYIEEGEAPPESVTLKAKAELEKRQPVAQEVPELSAQTAGGAHSSRPSRGIPRSVYIAVAAAVLVIAAVLLVVLLYGNSSISLNGEGLSDNDAGADAMTYSIDCEYLTKAGTDVSELLREGGVFPFVEQEDVEVSVQYALTVAVGSHDAGDIVLYKMECVLQPDSVSAVIYVEAADIYLDGLELYKSLSPGFESGGTEFAVGEYEGATLVYFLANGYGYNIRLETSDRLSVESVLENISQNIS